MTDTKVMPKPLRVVHVTLSIQEGTGGPAQSVTSFCQALARHGCDVTICAVDWGERFGEPVPIDPALVKVRTIRGYVWPKPRLWLTHGFGPFFREIAQGADIIHSHGFWLSIDDDAARFARRKNIPHIVSIRGTLAPASLRRVWWKKAIAKRLYADRNLRAAACLHATAEQEMQDVRAYGLGNPVAVIPNGLDCAVYATLDRPTAQAEMARLWPELAGKRILLFMSRIHPHKGLISLVEAWGRLHRQHGDWRLVIAGPDEVGHQRSLLAAATQNGSQDSITFTGPVYGQARLSLFAACDLFVLPSLSENFGMVVAEAMASGRPVITTVGAPWQELETHRCGWRIPLGTEPLTEQLAAALSLSDAELTDMGQRGRQLIRSHRYSLESVAGETLAVYRWMLGRGERPACVHVPTEDHGQ